MQPQLVLRLHGKHARDCLVAKTKGVSVEEAANMSAEERRPVFEEQAKHASDCLVTKTKGVSVEEAGGASTCL